MYVDLLGALATECKHKCPFSSKCFSAQLQICKTVVLKVKLSWVLLFQCENQRQKNMFSCLFTVNSSSNKTSGVPKSMRYLPF